MNDKEKIYLIVLILGFTLLYFKISKGIEEIYILLALMYIGVSFFTFNENIAKNILKADLITFSLLSLFALTVSVPDLVHFSLFFLIPAMVSFFWSMYYKIRLKFNKKQKSASAKVKVPTLKEYLKNRIVGQNEAVQDITRQISINIKKAETKKRVPKILGTFFFVGPTGVGKTETAKALAEWFRYKYGHQFLRFDMGNFSDQHTASTLVGSPKGYIGSEEGGALTRPLMANPKAVILFDEVEKSHHSLYKTFMALIDEGEIQEISTGTRVILNQSIIVFTSNLFQRTISEIANKNIDDIKKEIIIRDLLNGRYHEAEKIVGIDVVEKDLNNLPFTFPPEFIGRIDKIVPFRSLSFHDLVNIVSFVLQTYNKPVNMDTVFYITKKYEPVAKEYGVRVFIKKIEEEIL